MQFIDTICFFDVFIELQFKDLQLHFNSTKTTKNSLSPLSPPKIQVKTLISF